MSLAREVRCVFCTFARPARSSRVLKQRSFHTSPRYFAGNKPTDSPDDETSTVKFDEYKDVSEQELKKHYTPEQQAAIKAANKVLKPELLQKAGRDTRPWTLDYYDDLSSVDPVVDKPVKAPWTNLDESLRLKTDDELNEDLYNLMTNLPEDEDKAVEVWRDFDNNMRLTVGREEAERNPRSATAPEIPSFQAKGNKTRQKSKAKDAGDSARSQASPALVQLMHLTGLSDREIRGLTVKTLMMRRVTNQTRLGKIHSISCLSIAGNANGLIGFGMGKADEHSDAQEQSRYRAIKDMSPILRYENRTIFGEVKGKVGATELELYARPPGFGVRCQSAIFEICKAAGISDMSARVTRARNLMNTVKATIEALRSQKDPEDIARARGKKMVDVRKVYYANQV